MSNKLWGCLGTLIVLAGIIMCVWLTIQTGFGKALMENKPLFHISVPKFSLPLNSIAQPAQAAASDPSYSVVGKPSLSVTFMNQVLASYHSPAAGLAQYLYNDGVTYTIDPAYALAFFMHESDFGTTGVARVTRSLGNIRCSPGYRCIDGFRAYTTWIAGFQDWYALIRNLYVARWHLTTIAQIVPVYAPTSDGNDPAGYIAAVEQAVSKWRRGEVPV